MEIISVILFIFSFAFAEGQVTITKHISKAKPDTTCYSAISLETSQFLFLISDSTFIYDYDYDLESAEYGTWTRSNDTILMIIRKVHDNIMYPKFESIQDEHVIRKMVVAKNFIYFTYPGCGPDNTSCRLESSDQCKVDEVLSKSIQKVFGSNEIKFQK